MSTHIEARWSGLAGKLAWNLAGESIPVLAAVVAIPILVHRLGADRFGVLTLSWIIAGYFGLFDFGLGRALTKAMAQELSLGRDAKAAELFWTALAVMLTLGAAAAVSLAMITPWLARGALKIPLALQHETLAGLYVIAVGLPMLISSSALRAGLTAAGRFDLLNLIRTPSGIMSFAAPVLVLPFTHNLGWLIAALMANRAASWLIYFSAIFRALPKLESGPAPRSGVRRFPARIRRLDNGIQRSHSADDLSRSLPDRRADVDGGAHRLLGPDGNHQQKLHSAGGSFGRDVPGLCASVRRRA